MKLSLRQRLFFYFAVLFTVFSIGIALLEHSRERAIKTEALEEKLDLFAMLVHSKLTGNDAHYSSDIEQIKSSLPDELRITIIDLQGKVKYDNKVMDFENMENHANRLEVISAAQHGKGTYIRESSSNHHPYFYYAKKYSDHYVRVALPYNIHLKQFLQAGNLFLYFLLALFIITLFVIHKITQQFGDSIKQLQNFAFQNSDSSITFREDELGEIGKKIAENYRQLEANKKTLSIEKKKLLQHIQISEEGICFISSDHDVEFYNGLFIQYLNQLTDNPGSNPTTILREKGFEELHDFLRKGKEKYFESKIKKHGKIFSLRTNIFDDNSYEIILTDITRREKTRQLKQEMTGNIAHELRTPVTSIRAYLETILKNSVPEEKKQHFIEQAYHQTLTLSEMIKDMSFIAKMEEAPDSFESEPVNIPDLLARLKEESSKALFQKRIAMDWQLPENLVINGNLSLLTSIFRNLTENAIRYAGEDINININIFNEDKDYYYFSYHDTGIGVENEAHLNRLFERFYRVQEGRTRDTGGSGLGLSIVKNAVLFHKGTITAKNRKGGGLEFLFKLHK